MIIDKPMGSIHPCEQAALDGKIGLGGTVQFSIAPPLQPPGAKGKGQRRAARGKEMAVTKGKGEKYLPATGADLRDRAHYVRALCDETQGYTSGDCETINSHVKALVSEANRPAQNVHCDFAATDAAVREAYPELSWGNAPAGDGSDTAVTEATINVVGRGNFGASGVIALDDGCRLIVEGRVVNIPKGMLLEFSQLDMHQGAPFASKSARLHVYNDVAGKPKLWTQAKQKTVFVGGWFDPSGIYTSDRAPYTP